MSEGNRDRCHNFLQLKLYGKSACYQTTKMVVLDILHEVKQFTNYYRRSFKVTGLACESEKVNKTFSFTACESPSVKLSSSIVMVTDKGRNVNYIFGQLCSW